ncbi:uncharacterized protein PHA67_005009 isoform 2-T2 [Liasis olivaceus]
MPGSEAAAEHAGTSAPAPTAAAARAEGAAAWELPCRWVSTGCKDGQATLADFSDGPLACGERVRLPGGPPHNNPARKAGRRGQPPRERRERQRHLPADLGRSLAGPECHTFRGVSLPQPCKEDVRRRKRRRTWQGEHQRWVPFRCISLGGCLPIQNLDYYSSHYNGHNTIKILERCLDVWKPGNSYGPLGLIMTWFSIQMWFVS